MLYIMRHGKTDWNAEHRLQGSRDIPLNEEGRNMAKEIIGEYSEVKFDVCYVSPLQRARETAELFLASRNVPIMIDDRLREMCFGGYEGMANVSDHPELNICKMFKDPEHYVPDRGAESFEELFDRTGQFIEEVVEPQLAQGKNILIVGHGASNTSIICRYRKIPLEKFWTVLCKNCDLIRLA